MTERFSPSRSINSRILYCVLKALLLALLLFWIISALGSLALSRIYMSPSAVSSRKARIYSELNTYVSSKEIKGTDSAALARWTGDKRFTIILIYNKNGDLILRASEGQAQSSSSMQTYERMQLAVEYGKLYPMRFADGVYNVAIGDYSQKREKGINIVVAALLAVICFFTLILWDVRRLTDRIIRLSREAVTIGEGDLEAPISAEGGDEISTLAKEVDNMRNSVIERMSNEKRAWEANSELITAISHDIRTPMTSLIGYLELLKNSGFEDKERAAQFCSSAFSKAQELKVLTDELFKYFLVFGSAELSMKMESFDSRLLLEQLLGEAGYELTSCGFKLREIGFEGSCCISADPLYMKRVVDNLVSNIKKYADRDKYVVFLTELKDNKLSVCISNTVSRSAGRVESTRIGIRTCERIMEQMGGSFSISRDEEHFAAEFTLPVIPEE